MWLLLGSACVSGQHLIEELVGHAAFDELVFREDSVVVLVHLVEDLLSPFVRSIARIGHRQRRTDHLEYCLQRIQ